jgi:hypothetical protein
MADLPAEIVGPDTAARAEAAFSVFNKSRNCQAWRPYQVGFDPKEHLMEQRVHDLEMDRRAFTTALNGAGKWLAVAALIVGLAQVMTLTPESLLYRFGGFIWSRVASFLSF